MTEKVVVNPESDLQPRPGDEPLGDAELKRFELFKGFKKVPTFDKYPGAVLLRRFRKGDVLFRQGDPGASAFYILTSEDVLTLKREQLAAARKQLDDAKRGRSAELLDQMEDLTNLVSVFERRLTECLDRRPDGQPARRVCTAYLLVDTGRKSKPRGVWSRLFGGGAEKPEVRPEFIPNDGPTDIDYETKQAPMFEGDVFGEMSCLTLAPRSATVVADVDCFLVEFLRNIFDAMVRDPGYRERLNAAYRERVLKGDLRRMAVLKDLTDDELNRVRDRCDLEVVDPGQVICDEHDPSDAVYVIRSGMVQVVADLNLTLHPHEITDWPEFCRQLESGGGNGAS